DGGGLLVRGEGAADAGLAVGLAGTLGQDVLDRRVAGETERRAELGGGGVQAGDRAPLVDLRGAPGGVQLVELRAGVDAGAGVLGREEGLIEVETHDAPSRGSGGGQAAALTVGVQL